MLNHIRVVEAFEGFGLSIKSSFTSLSIAIEDLSHVNCLIFATFLLNLPSIGAVASCERLSINILILTGVFSVSGDGLTSDNSTDQWLNDSDISDESSNGIIVVEDVRQ
jgi:hypothetical protein